MIFLVNFKLDKKNHIKNIAAKKRIGLAQPLRKKDPERGTEWEGAS